MALKRRNGAVPYTVSMVTSDKLQEVIADHDRGIFEGIAVTAATTAANFSATHYVVLKDSSGAAIAYIPCAAAAW